MHQPAGDFTVQMCQPVVEAESMKNHNAAPTFHCIENSYNLQGPKPKGTSLGGKFYSILPQNHKYIQKA